MCAAECGVSQQLDHEIDETVIKVYTGVFQVFVCVVLKHENCEGRKLRMNVKKNKVNVTVKEDVAFQEDFEMSG